MRVATFNILHGRTVGDGVDPQRLRDLCASLIPTCSRCKRSTATNRVGAHRSHCGGG